ncbi:hypothetical protein GH714_044102 [Hevea brasiliensis]|uniref:Uncharacterized protein n=1 Tax=Hevea brasiliensis TaxID=3981 RepID=A0A6A6K1A6_HEVBR|nr:hypothetical protein GH714_044102 [Hevea brasiliensis]
MVLLESELSKNERQKLIWSGKTWLIIPLACGYLWRLVCQSDNRKSVTVNHETLIQIQHGGCMSEFKGTNGEWRSDEAINGNYSIVALRDRYVVEIGQIDSKQDANLIAAAPELLEALQDALHAYDKHAKKGGKANLPDEWQEDYDAGLTPEEAWSKAWD